MNRARSFTFIGIAVIVVLAGAAGGNARVERAPTWKLVVASDRLEVIGANAASNSHAHRSGIRTGLLTSLMTTFDKRNDLQIPTSLVLTKQPRAADGFSTERRLAAERSVIADGPATIFLPPP